MSLTRAQLGAWFDTGVANGMTHMVVVVDTFDHCDYPVYVRPGSDPRVVADEYDNKNMQRVMEVYCLGMSKDGQLAERRAFHYADAPSTPRPHWSAGGIDWRARAWLGPRLPVWLCPPFDARPVMAWGASLVHFYYEAKHRLPLYPDHGLLARHYTNVKYDRSPKGGTP